MKLLISAEGTTLSSKVSKRFGHAPQYLIVDTGSLDIQPVTKTEKISKQDLITGAVQEGVVGVITGHVGPHAFAALAAHSLFAILAHHVTVAEAIERFNRNELRILSAPSLQVTADVGRRPAASSRQTAGKRSARNANTVGYVADTARGRHHLQQFAGRGH
jgi:predicted Fe-Mo cluster-binding NifX family protein